MRYLDFIEKSAQGDLLDHGLGDWITLDDSTPRALVATCGWVRMLDSAAGLADALDTPGRGAFRARAKDLRRKLETTYVDRLGVGGTIGSGSQASLALLIDVNVLTRARRADAARELIQLIHREGDRITVGEIGLAALQRVLIEHDDTASVPGVHQARHSELRHDARGRRDHSPRALDRQGHRRVGKPLHARICRTLADTLGRGPATS